MGLRQPVCLLVLGMHRSGTSAVSRILNLLGAKLPERLVGAEPGNERGHWEPASIVALNDEILAAAKSAWDDFSALEMDFASPLGREFKARAVQILETEYASCDLCLIKDPRISRLLPFWLDVLKQCEVRPGIVLAIRNPVEVAQSLAARDGMLPAYAHLVWARHVLDAEHDSRGVPRSVIAYEALLDDWGSVVDRIGADVGVDLSWRQNVAGEIDAFLTPELRHHRGTADAANDDPTVPALVRKAYQTIRQAVEGKAVDGNALDDLRKELDRPTSDMLEALRTELVLRRQSIRDLRQQALGLQEEVSFFRPRSQELEKELYAEQLKSNKESERLHRRWHASIHRINILGSEVTRLRDQNNALEAEGKAREEHVRAVEARLKAEVSARDHRINALESALAHFRQATTRLQERWDRRIGARISRNLTRVSRRLLRRTRAR